MTTPEPGVRARFSGMNAKVAFQVYPVRAAPPGMILVHAGNVIGQFDAKTGVGVLNAQGSGYKSILDLATATPFTFPSWFVTVCRQEQAKLTPPAETHPLVDVSDVPLTASPQPQGRLPFLTAQDIRDYLDGLDDWMRATVLAAVWSRGSTRVGARKIRARDVPEAYWQWLAEVRPEAADFTDPSLPPDLDGDPQAEAEPSPTDADSAEGSGGDEDA